MTAVVAAAEADDDDNKERHCDSLIMCIVTTLNEGLRNGGGIGDVLRKPSSTVCVIFKPVYTVFLHFVSVLWIVCNLNVLHVYVFLCQKNSDMRGYE